MKNAETRIPRTASRLRTFAHLLRLEKSGGDPEKVYELNSIRCAVPIALWKPSSANFRLMPHRTEGREIELCPGTGYYANKLKNARYACDEEALRPYFELGSVS